MAGPPPPRPEQDPGTEIVECPAWTAYVAIAAMFIALVVFIAVVTTAH